MIPVLYRFPSWIPVLGDQAITSFGALLFVALLAGGALFVRRLRGRDPLRPGGEAALAPSGGWEVVVAAAVGGMIGAKLMHLGIHAALGLPSAALGRAGLDWFGGLIGGAAAGLWQARRAGLDLALVAAAAAPAIALGYAVGRVGSFLVGADYGVPTTAPWGVAFPAGAPPTTPANLVQRFGAAVPPGGRAGDFVRVHPTQLYEAVLSLGILYLLLRSAGQRTARWGWRVAALFLILHGSARAAVELVRAKEDRLAGPITVDLLLALGTVGAGIALHGRGRRVPRATEPA